MDAGGGRASLRCLSRFCGSSVNVPVLDMITDSGISTVNGRPFFLRETRTMRGGAVGQASFPAGVSLFPIALKS